MTTAPSSEFYLVRACLCGSWRRAAAVYFRSGEYCFVQCYDCYRWHLEERLELVTTVDVSRETITPQGE